MKARRLFELKQIVASSYELTAVHFDATRSKIAAADFRWAAGQIKADDEVFDAGCGNGRLLDYSHLSPEKYLGFDQSRNLLSLAQARHPDYRFLAGELSDLSIFSDNQFSVIFCSAVISHIPDRLERRRILREFLRLSRPGGHLLINFWKMEGKNKRRLYLTRWQKLIGRHPYGWRDLIFPWKSADGQIISSRYYHAFTKRGFRREIQSAGWQIEVVKNDRFNYWLLARRPK